MMGRLRGAYRGVHVEGTDKTKVYVCQDGPLEILRVRVQADVLRPGDTIELERPGEAAEWSHDEATGTWVPVRERFLYRVDGTFELHYVGRPSDG